MDVLGHGTQVAAIACGSSGVAAQADILVVKLGLAAKNGFPRTTQLMEALDYVVRKAIDYGNRLRSTSVLATITGTIPVVLC